MAKPYAHLGADHLSAYAGNPQVHDTFQRRPLGPASLGTLSPTSTGTPEGRTDFAGIRTLGKHPMRTARDRLKILFSAVLISQAVADDGRSCTVSVTPTHACPVAFKRSSRRLVALSRPVGTRKG